MLIIFMRNYLKSRLEFNGIFVCFGISEQYFGLYDYTRAIFGCLEHYCMIIRVIDCSWNIIVRYIKTCPDDGILLPLVTPTLSS